MRLIGWEISGYYLFNCNDLKYCYSLSVNNLNSE